MQQCKTLHASLMPLNDAWNGPLRQQSHQSTALPAVLLLGNHSSGKSSFINYVLGQKVQTTGVAPTDDAFTIIAPGPIDRNQDGPALVGDPDLGFGPLRQFGPTLLHHTQLKIRSNLHPSPQFLLIDSPGMIDAPASHAGMLQGSGNNSSNTTTLMDRGYDFTGVVRWLADRADVVCLFFDPDKPGTTGETLSVLLHALSGMDHKLCIVLNKADQFTQMQDFARAYGSLCWNLSKVIPRKDLPQIYTMCLPTHTTTDTTGTDKEATNATTKTVGMLGSLQDLHAAREQGTFSFWFANLPPKGVDLSLPPPFPPLFTSNNFSNVFFTHSGRTGPTSPTTTIG
jgi:hypothetical protein